MAITPTGKATPQYTSTPTTVTEGEARTVLIMKTQLTGNPPVQATMADDAGPAGYGGSPAPMSHFGQNPRWLFLDEKAT